MSPRRARIIRRQVLASETDEDFRYQSTGAHVRQEQSDGRIRRFFTALKEALAKPKTYLVTGEITSPARRRYRAAKRAWVRRPR
jgi:hypothetical protein